jgi:FkbM family methyltransferase
VRPIFVETMRLDTWRTKFDTGKVDLIKMDVEGAELKVLRRMGETTPLR